ncbi:MAG TPA: methyl-accepting chemotaxis protein [Smithellaceae bacterium]|nr:methyl-accepting chemotaxis protein [Smithellaceae bacterium]
MKSYTAKIVAIYSAVFSAVHCGWLVSTYVFMANSPTQQHIFTLQGIAAWTLTYLAALPFIFFWTAPVNSALNSLKAGGNLSDHELLSIAKKNQRIPIYCAIIMDVMITAFDILLVAGYKMYDIGPIASTGIWATNIAAITSFPVIVIGGMNLVVNPVHGYFNDELTRRGRIYSGKTLTIRNKLLLVFMIIAVALCPWLTAFGFYSAGIYQVKEELKSNTLAYQQVAVNTIKLQTGENPGMDALKQSIDKLHTGNLGFAFLADKNGQIIYNPSGREIFVRTWKDIDDQLIAHLKEGNAGAMYENVHESVISVTPINGEFRLGMVSPLGDRMPRFMTFFLGMLVILVIAAVISFMAGFTFITYIGKSITDTVHVLKDLSEGEGDLTVRFKVVSEDETGAMARHFNAFMGKLNEMIQLGQKATQSVEQGAVQQASAIEETTASMEEFVHSLARNLADTQDMDKLIGNITQDMDRVNQTMKFLMRGMEDLKMASTETGKIIKSIDGIAFQTNLLALNAAVEAARAGEAGAGFAVVAGEVRNLAMRASQAAKSTTELIEKNVRQINEGYKLVDQTGQDFTVLVKKTMDSRALVLKISESVKKQDQTVQMVNKALKEIDKMTQWNVSQVDQLNNNMSRFRTSETEDEI